MDRRRGGAPASQGTGRPGAALRRVRTLAATTLTTLTALLASTVPLANVAGAAPADLDSTFGADGVATLTVKNFTMPLDRIAARPDGRLVVASFSTPTNRLHLVGLRADGSLDPTWGSDGVVDSGLGNPSSSVDFGALTTQVVDGETRIVAAGAVKSGNGGKVTVAVTRFTPAGAPDPSFGQGGIAAFDIGGGPDDHATAVTAAGDKLLVAARNSKGAADFTVLRLDVDGSLDPSFGSRGRASTDIAGGADVARDVAVDRDGRIVVTGVARRNNQDDIAVVRYTSAGALDPTFGSGGKVALDGSGSGQPDGGRSVAVDRSGDGATNAVYVGGTVAPAGAATSGVVVKLSGAGVPDGTFGAGGVLRNVRYTTQPGESGTITAIAVDSSRRLVVAGTSTAAGGTGAIGLARLTPTGASPYDPAFSAGTGRRTAGACDSDGILGAGLAIDSASRIVASGACSTGRYLRVVRLLAANPLANLTYSLTPSSEAAGRQRTPLDALDPLAAFRQKLPGEPTGTGGTDAKGTGLGSIGLGSIGLGSIGLGSIGLGSIGLGSIGLGSIGLGSIGLGSIGLGSIGLGNDAIPLLLSEIGLGSIDWPTLLADVPALRDVPLQSITIQQLYAQPDLPDSIRNLTLADVSSIRNVGLGSISVQAILLSQPLDGLPDPVDAAGAPRSWCEFLADQPYRCPDVDPSTTNLFAIEARGVDLDGYYARPLSLLAPATQLTVGGRSAIVAAVPLAEIDLGRARVGAAPANELPSLVTCDPSCTGSLAAAQDAGRLEPGVVVNDLVEALPTPGAPALTLGDVLAMMLPAALVPYESISLDGILDQAAYRTDHLVDGQVAFDLDCSQSAGLRATVVLPTGFRYVPGSSSVATTSASAPTGDPVADGGAVRWDTSTGFAPSACPAGTSGVRRVSLQFRAEPSAILGTSSPSTAVVASDADQAGLQAHAADPVVVDDSLDAGDSLASCPPMSADQLYTFHLSRPDDIDCFRIAAPGTPGAKVTVTASHLPADYDVVLLGAPTGPQPSSGRQEYTGLGSIGLGSIGLGSISVVPDGRDEPGSDAGAVQPNPLQDVLDPTTVPDGYVVRNYSATRGTANESASLIVDAVDVGREYIVRFSGFNGAAYDAGASSRPAVARVIVADAPEPLPCITRTYAAGGTPRPSVGTVPAGTQTLFLAAPKRMGDIYGPAAVDALMDGTGANPQGVAQLAGRADVKGAVLNVDADPAVAQAYSAWDAEPCSVAKANAVVTAVNEVVDAAIAGATGLRHIVVVGNDEVIPMARLRDDAVEANQRDYVDQARFAGRDNPISRAFLEGNLLSDDVIGDLDPYAALGGSFHDPDVAVGRLVETPAEIQGTVSQYFTANGVLDPTTAFVTGYDFLTDGATAVKANLARPDGAGNPSRIDETWTAADAANGVNQPGTGFRSVNAHYSHWQGLPARAFNDGTADLFTSASFTPPAGNVLFTMGCQGGLNVPDIFVTGPAALDFPQAAQRSRSSWVGNTGFGYGDTEAVAYSEKLMATYAKNVAGGTMTAGQALLFAKKSYVAGQPLFSAYDRKAISEAAFYGLPMYRIGAAGQVAAPALPPAHGASTAVLTSTKVVSTDLTATNGYFVDGAELPLVVPQRPIVGIKSVDVTSTDGVPVTGAVLEGGTIVERPDPGRTFACPTVDLEANEPCGPAGDKQLTFPTAFQAVSNTMTTAGRRDVLQVLPDQWSSDGGTAVNRQLVSGAFTLYRTSNPGTPCPIEAVEADVVQGGLRIDVRSGDCTADRAVALYQIDSTTLRRVELTVGAGRATGVAALPAGVTSARGIYVQLVKGGMVSTSVDKTTGYAASSLPTGPGVSLSPPRPASGYYTAVPVTVTVDDSHGTPVQCVINDQEPFVVTGPFEVSEEGVNTIVCTAPDGTSTTVVVAIDTVAPIVTPVASSQPNAAGWYVTKPVTVTARCADPEPGSGSPAQGTTATFTDDGAGQSRTVSCTDTAGNTSTTTFTANIDTGPPDTTITGQSVVLLGGTISGTATDATSRPASVKVVYTPTFLGAAKTVVVDLSGCTTTTCSWSAPPPDVAGTYDVTATATDRAGLVDPTPATLGNLTVR